MAASRIELLSARVTTGSISTVAGATSLLLTLLGMQPGGPRVRGERSRHFGWDIFKNVREMAQMRAPNTPAATTRPNPVGRVEAESMRFYEVLPLDYERLMTQRVIGGPFDTIDQSGRNYLSRQQAYLGQRIANARLGTVAGMIRGKGYIHKGTGDTMWYDFANSAGNYMEIDYRIPSGNKNQLNMLGTGNIIDLDWDDPTADIPGHYSKINAALQQLCGSTLDITIVNSTRWNKTTENDHVVAKGGVIDTPWSEFARQPGQAENGMRRTTFTARLKALPWLTFLITDEGLNIGQPGQETYTKFIGDNEMWFGPDPNSPNTFGTPIMEMVETPEAVVEVDGGPMTPRTGVYAWTRTVSNPASVQMFSLDNQLPTLYVPSSTGFATVSGF